MVSITVHGSHEIPVLGPDDILGPFGRPDTPRMGPTSESRETLWNAGYMDVDPLARSPSRSLRPGGDRF